MKPINSQLVLVSLYLLLISIAGKAQSADTVGTTWIDDKPFELATYMSANRTVNLMVMVKQVTGVTLKVKNADDATLHELQMKKSPKAYHIRLNFDSSQSGAYKLEISDGRKTFIRQIDVVDLPATEAQRYITFMSPSTL